MDKAFNSNISACRLTLCKCHVNTFARKARLCYGNNKEGIFNFLVLCPRSRMMHSKSQDDLDAVFPEVCTLLLSKSMTERVVAVFSGARI